MKKLARWLTLSVGLLGTALAPIFAWSQAEPQRVEISAKRFVFTPNEITLKKGQPVTLVLKSMDVGHGLRISGLGVAMQVKAGQTAQVTITPNTVGDFVGHCSVFCGSGHGSMTITVHVVA
jgi:cytochrome c oxidase subunit II